MSNEAKRFEQFEDDFQATFDNVELSFKPQNVVTVHLVSFKREKSLQERMLHHKNPRVDFYVSCPKVKHPNHRRFKTHQQIVSKIANIALAMLMDGNELINQTFQFVIPEDINQEENIPIQIEACQQQFFLHRVISEKLTVDTANLPEDGKVISKTLVFEKINIQLIINVNKSLRTSPDFRYSLGLGPGERAFRKKRIPIVYEAMKKLLGEEKGPNDLIETPIVSVTGSGGGYRAMCGMSGAMAAFQDAGLMDTITYLSGVSGSSWYLASAYSQKGIIPQQQSQFHENIKDGFKHNAISAALLRPNSVRKYEKYLRKSCKNHGQIHTFANYFPGFIIGKKIMRKQIFGHLSSMIPLVEKGTVPYPILVALEVKNNVKASEYHVYMERTPYEISFPSYGINIKTVDDASTWFGGFRLLRCPEFPLQFTIAMTGCAFSILANSIKEGFESDQEFLDFLETARTKCKELGPEDDKTDDDFDISSDHEDVNEVDSKIKPPENSCEIHNFENFDTISNSSFPDSENSSEASSYDSTDDNTVDDLEEVKPNFKRLNRATIKEFKKTDPTFISRNAVVGRTVRIHNFALGMSGLKRFSLNPFSGSRAPEDTVLDKICGRFGEQKNIKHGISTKREYSYIADAGVLNNVAPDIVLRPQRTTDLLIVLDFNAYEDDSLFDYQPLIFAQRYSWGAGIEFPRFNQIKEVGNQNPSELIIIPSNSPFSPTVLWFTLSNLKFRNLKDYKKMSTSKPSKNEREKTEAFNDFTVFGDDTNFGTLTFHMTRYNFDQLYELMYYNVKSHIEEIKSALSEAVLRKRQRLKSFVSKG